MRVIVKGSLRNPFGTSVIRAIALSSILGYRCSIDAGADNSTLMILLETQSKCQ